MTVYPVWSLSSQISPSSPKSPPPPLFQGKKVIKLPTSTSTSPPPPPPSLFFTAKWANNGLIWYGLTLHVQHTFFVNFFVVVLHDYTRWNFEKLFSSVALTVCDIFILEILATRPANDRYRSNCSNQNGGKEMKEPQILSRSRSLSPFFSLSFAGLSPTFSFLRLSLALYSKFVDITINLSLIL